MTPGQRAEIEAALGTGLAAVTPRAGGDINRAYRLSTDDGRALFAKVHDRPPPGMFEAEADGLRWLAAANALRVPDVLAVCPHALVLEDLGDGRGGPEHDEALGLGLAGVHRAGAPAFGWTRDNTIGTLPQDNRPAESWPSFYAHRRLGPQLKRAVDAGRASPTLVRGVEGVIDRIEDLVGPPEPPARLHGDLWAGNVHTAADGQPCLIDPAVYGGHREVDLAMMRLFGGFADAVFDAYRGAFPLAAGWPERVGLYQLYPLLVHVNLFGGGYGTRAAQIAGRYGG